MGTISQTFKKLDKETGKWVTVTLEREFVPKGSKKPKMRQMIKNEPYLLSVFDK